MATLYAKTAGGNWSAAGTWSTVNAGGGDSSGPPTAADNVIFELLSGNVTVDVNSVCRSLDVTSGTGVYTGTITGTASVTLSIGDGTAGPGNVALKLDAGMTFTRSATSFTLSFVSTSATQQTIMTAGKTMGGMTWNGVGGSWILSDSITASTAALTLTNGALDTGNQTINCGTFSSNNSNVRTLTLGTSSITPTQFPNSWLIVGTNLTFSAGSSTINLTNTGDQTLNGGGLTYGTLIISTFSTTQVKTINGANTFGTLTITGGAQKTDTVNLGANQTVTGTLTINGNSATNRVLIASDTLGTARTITNNAGTTSITNADFRDITGAGSASWNLSGITGGSGDCQGNSGITFTTATTRYWVGGTGSWSSTGEWSTSSGGASGASVPLPQDDVVFDANSFSAGSQTVTQDMPRFAKSVNWTGATNSPTWTINTTNQRMYGSLTLISAMSLTQSQVLLFEGRGSMTLTSAGKQLPNTVTLSMFGGTLTLQDAFSTAGTFNLNNGTFDSNGFSVTCNAFVTNGSLTRTLTMGASNWTLVGGVATVWNAASAGLTVTAGAVGTIFITDTSANNKLFLGAGKTYGNLTITGGGSGTVTIQNANTFNTITCNAPKTLIFVSATTHTIKRLVVMGASGSVITITSSIAASAATLSQAGGVTAGDWLSIQDITFSPSAAATFYAGANSTNVSGNTGITFKQLTAMNAGVP